MFVKGIKKGKIIELLEDVDFPDNQEVLVEIKKINDFWSALQDFRQRVDLEGIDDDSFWEMTLQFREKMEREGIVFADDDFANLRDKSPGREVNL